MTFLVLGFPHRPSSRWTHLRPAAHDLRKHVHGNQQVRGSKGRLSVTTVDNVLTSSLNSWQTLVVPRCTAAGTVRRIAASTGCDPEVRAKKQPHEDTSPDRMSHNQPGTRVRRGPVRARLGDWTGLAHTGGAFGCTLLSPYTDECVEPPTHHVI